MARKVLISCLFSLFCATSTAQDQRALWVDSVYNTLSADARIGQLFMVPISSYQEEDDLEELASQIEDDRVGSLLIYKGSPMRLVQLLKDLQKKSKVPLLTGISAEWGVAENLDSVLAFQKPIVAAAWKEDRLFVAWATQIGWQMKKLGLHLNFAPNADDEIIADDYKRFFSNDPERATSRAVLFMKTLQSMGLLAIARRLPNGPSAGFGNGPPVITPNDIDTTHLFVLKSLISQGIDGVLTSDLRFTTTGNPTSVLSPVLSADILKAKMKFKGLLICDLKDYKKTVGKVSAGESELLAFETGNDIIIGSLSNQGLKQITKALKKNKNLAGQLEYSVKKILGAKFDAGLQHPKPVDTDNLIRRFHAPEVLMLKRKMTEAAVTVVKNEKDILPVRRLDERTFVCVSIGKEKPETFHLFLRKYAPFQTLTLKEPKDTAAVFLQKNPVIILSIHEGGASLENQLLGWTRRLLSTHPTIVVHFGDPRRIASYPDAAALIAAYDEGNAMAELVPQVIFGGLSAQGIFPVTTSSYTIGDGMQTEITGRLTYTLPEAAGMDSQTLEKIQGLMEEVIREHGTPGCHLLVAKDGKVVLEKSAGSLTYDNTIPVTDETIYDLASLTKTSATLQTTMFLYERGLIDLDKKASVYLPELKGTNKENLILKDILTHQAGLWPTIFYWTQTMKDTLQMPEYYSKQESPDFPYPVAPNLFASKAMKDSLRHWTIYSKMREKPPRTPFDYRYSDVGSYLLQYVSEKLLNQPMEDFLQQNFYEPLGASTMGYLPLRKFPKEQVAPTENDTIFRKRLLIGYVHDQGAAMSGGIAGHAGLFSDANDLAKLGQMWLQKGTYGGERYFKPETIELFTSKQFENSRRGLGWDKPPQSDWNGPTSVDVSSQTFGHTGFTGTCIWVDPEFNLVYIFLSNRVNPDVNGKFGALNIRPRIQEVIYKSIFNYRAVYPETKVH